MNQKKFFLLLFCLNLFSAIVSHSFAQQNTDLQNWHGQVNGAYLKSYWTDTKTIAASPFHWKGKEWGKFAAFTGILALSYTYEQEIFERINRQETSFTRRMSNNFIEPWGRGTYSIPLLATLYIFGNSQNQNREIALTAAKSFLITGGATYIVKYIFHRHRPHDNMPPDPRRWDGPIPFTTDYTSFPSGHTSSAFSIASVLAYGYKDKKWVGITAYTLAGLVGLSRVHDNKHWITDVMAGAALGTFIGITVSKASLNNKNNIEAVYYRGGGGLKYVLRLD